MARDTKLGPEEEFTRDIPNVSPKKLPPRTSTKHGIVHIGKREVRPATFSSAK